MPITKTMAYKVGDVTFTTFEEAQVAAISDQLVDAGEPLVSDEPLRKRIAGAILDRAEELIEILNCQPENEKKPRKPRSDKGKKRAAKEAAINRALQDMKQ